MKRLGKVAIVVFALFLFAFPLQPALADKPSTQSYTLAMSVNGYWNPDPGYSCPPQCEANTRVSGSGVLTYTSTSGVSTSVQVTVNGTVHAHWANINIKNPCAPMSATVQVNTATHDKLMLSVSGEECEIFVSGHYTHTNAITSTFEITSGAGVFQGASGSGSIAIKTIPNAHKYSATLTGSATFSDNGHHEDKSTTTSPAIIGQPSHALTWNAARVESLLHRA